MATEVTIVNLALNKLGERAITAFTDDSKAARLANRDYEEYRDSMLREFPWNFAAKRAEIPAEATAPAWGFARSFVLPSDFLRLLDVYNPDNEQWELAADQRIQTDLSSPLQIQYVYRVTNVDAMDPLFRQAFAARLAMEWAEPLTASSSVQERMAALYENKLRVARAADGQEDYPKVIEATSWDIARF